MDTMDTKTLNLEKQIFVSFVSIVVM